MKDIWKNAVMQEAIVELLFEKGADAKTEVILGIQRFTQLPAVVTGP
jgi:hypothetical protein